MKLLDYIKGNRKGKNANRIERSSMRDPFLYDAIEGFDSIKGNHLDNIEVLQARIRKCSKPSRSLFRKGPLWQVAAASSIVVIAFSTYMFISYQRSYAFAHEGRDLSTIDIYVPAVFFEQNEVIIEEKNEILVESYKPEIEAFRLEENISTSLTKEELEILSGDITSVKDQELMDIYIPDSKSLELIEAEMMYSKSKGKSHPVGGFDQYNAYINRNKIIPTDDICANKHGKVAVEFSIDEYGQPFQFIVVQSLCGVSDKEAIRLIKLGPKWAPTSERIIVKIEF